MSSPRDKQPDSHSERSPSAEIVVTPAAPKPLPKEVGGREGPEPTRFGDWEKAGRCIDF